VAPGVVDTLLSRAAARFAPASARSCTRRSASPGTHEQEAGLGENCRSISAPMRGAYKLVSCRTAPVCRGRDGAWASRPKSAQALWSPSARRQGSRSGILQPRWQVPAAVSASSPSSHGKKRYGSACRTITVATVIERSPGPPPRAPDPLAHCPSQAACIDGRARTQRRIRTRSRPRRRGPAWSGASAVAALSVIHCARFRPRVFPRRRGALPSFLRRVLAAPYHIHS